MLVLRFYFFFFFFKQKTAYEISSRDWSSDVCSSDLSALIRGPDEPRDPQAACGIGQCHAACKNHTEDGGERPTGEACTRNREDKRVADRVEGQRERCPDGSDHRGMA